MYSTCCSAVLLRVNGHHQCSRCSKVYGGKPTEAPPPRGASAAAAEGMEVIAGAVEEGAGLLGEAERLGRGAVEQLKRDISTPPSEDGIRRSGEQLAQLVVEGEKLQRKVGAFVRRLRAAVAGS